VIIFDTCTLLWLVRGEGLSPAVARRSDEADAAFVSAISALEIGIKVAKGQLALGLPPAQVVGRGAGAAWADRSAGQ